MRRKWRSLLSGDYTSGVYRDCETVDLRHARHDAERSASGALDP